MISKTIRDHSIRQNGDHWTIGFDAMASPCEILIRCNDESEVKHLASLSIFETHRIETKFSRYREDNIVHKINHSNGTPVAVDTETTRLLDYANQCHLLSDGLFDITSGNLRKAWTFDGRSLVPDDELINRLRERVGWNKVSWKQNEITLQPGMEIDLGGLGKEYAADRAAELIFEESGLQVMVNFGGDIRAVVSEKDAEAWTVGIEDPEEENSAIGEINLTNGGVATSGDLRRYCFVDGRRLGHILNPNTGWPVAEAPRSVTVVGQYCVEAGFLATLAMLQGADAEKFIKEQAIDAHCIR